MKTAKPHILLGVSGSIAAYKAPLLVREFVKHNAEVRVAMTPSASAFVTPLTLATLSRNPVVTEALPTDVSTSNAGTWHIDLGRWADVMLIAPASANTIAKLLHGEADNPVAMLALSLRCPLIIAPAMDEEMLINKATQTNLETLKARGVHVISTAHGELASGLVGEGRLAEIGTIVEYVNNLLAKKKSLQGVRVLVTAGPTHEPIDPVRFLGNRSSGKMGFAIAEEAAQRGADVTLVSGPSELRNSPAIKRINVETAAEMYSAVKKEHKKCDILIMAAAVADFTPKKYSPVKSKKQKGAFPLELVPTKDILKELVASKGKTVHVGFALETDNELNNAKKKLKEKKLDMIVLNSVSEKGAGFGVDTNVITIIDKKGDAKKFPMMTKQECAEVILDNISRKR